MAAAALQNVAAMVEKGLQCLFQAHHPRHAVGVEDIQVERHPHFELGQPEELLHQHFRIDIAGLRLEDEADILSRFVAHIGEERQLFVFEQPGDLFDEPALWHLIGHLGDDDAVGAVAERFLVPARPQPKAAAARLIGRADCVGRLDQHPAGREIGAADMRSEGLDRASRLVDQMQQGRA